MAPSARNITIDTDTLEADILALADRSASLGLSDLGEHLEGMSLTQWDLTLVYQKLDDLTSVGGPMARNARDAMRLLREL